jgi:hypothetical protein
LRLGHFVNRQIRLKPTPEPPGLKRWPRTLRQKNHEEDHTYCADNEKQVGH